METAKIRASWDAEELEPVADIQRRWHYRASGGTRSRVAPLVVAPVIVGHVDVCPSIRVVLIIHRRHSMTLRHCRRMLVLVVLRQVANRRDP